MARSQSRLPPITTNTNVTGSKPRALISMAALPQNRLAARVGQKSSRRLMKTATWASTALKICRRSLMVQIRPPGVSSFVQTPGSTFPGEFSLAWIGSSLAAKRPTKLKLVSGITKTKKIDCSATATITRKADALFLMTWVYWAMQETGSRKPKPSPSIFRTPSSLATGC